MERLDVPEELFSLYSPCVGKELGPGNQDLARFMTKTHHPLPAEYHLVKDCSLAFEPRVLGQARILQKGVFQIEPRVPLVRIPHNPDDVYDEQTHL